MSELRNRKPQRKNETTESGVEKPLSKQCVVPQSDMAPLLLRPWVYFQEVLPPVMLFGLNISVTLASLIFFIVVRITGRTILSYNNWPPGDFDTMFTNSCMVAMSHSSSLILPLAQALWILPYKPTIAQSAAPKYWQLATDAMLQCEYILCELTKCPFCFTMIVATFSYSGI